VGSAFDDQGAGLPNVVFSISADSINKLSYINFTETAPKVVPIVGAGAPDLTATDAIVSFSSSKGTVATILPYISNRSATPIVKMEGGTQVIRGRFLRVWDGNGKNLAPNGATEVRLDPSSGRILKVME
jgi:hypothetical protein